jgi:iron(III) transport system substrate-binding protein
LGAGAFPTLFPNIPANTEPLKAKGAPVDSYLVSPTIGVEQVGGVVAKGPHPNAARLFLNWLLTSDGQTSFAGFQHAASVLKDVSGAIPLPQGYKHPDWASYAANKTKILGLLGLSAQ